VTTETGQRAAASGAPGSARIAWFESVGASTERDRPAPDVVLPAPAGVRAERGRGQVTVSWSSVPGAVGYLVHRGPRGGALAPIDHKGGDVLAVPHGPYVDTTLGVEGDQVYAVASLSSIDATAGPLSAPTAPVATDRMGEVTVEVDAARSTGPVQRPWRPIVGSEHLAMLLRGEGPGGLDVGEDLATAFRIVHAELGVEAVRAHAILHDVLGVYREDADGTPHFDFEAVDRVIERVLATGLRPVVELSFMPAALAADPAPRVFDYVGHISPPRDLGRWAALVEALVRHLVARHGLDEVARWPFEVWNEPNIQVFWSARQSDYFDLYDATARAVKAVDARLLVGGPATAAAGWVDDFLHHANEAGVPVDFVTTHTYGAPPLDLRPLLERHGRADLPLWWTEWGVSPSHGAAVNDSVWGAPLVARGMRSAAGRVDALAYWVASDQFVELETPERLLHGGFGLLTIGGLRKPRFWAIALLERLGEHELASEVTGDGGGSLVEAWASRDAEVEDGVGGDRVAVAIWNGTLDQSKTAGDDALGRRVTLEIRGLAPGQYTAEHHRVDHGHSNIARVWDAISGGDWPTPEVWERLRAADRLDALGPDEDVAVGSDGVVRLAFDLPMPAISFVELRRVS
jgi:xylan 1,4-beta-xylosidase